MIKTKIIIDKQEKTFQVPESWIEVTLLQLVNLEAWAGSSSDPVGLLSCFIDVDRDVISNSRRDYWKELLTVLNFVFNPPKWHNLTIPGAVSLDGKLVKVPRKLELERFGQKVAAAQYMAAMDSGSDNIKIIPDVMAVYFQPLIDGKFNRHRLEYIKGQILKMPAFQAVPIGRFFLTKFISSRNFGQLGLKRYLQTQRMTSTLMQQEVVN